MIPMPYEDNLNVITGHIALYQDAKFHKVNIDKARVIAKKYLTFIVNHPAARLHDFLEKEYSNPF